MKRLLSVLSVAALCTMLSGCNTTPKTAEDRNVLKNEADTVKAQFRKSDSDIARQMDNAYGMAVFPTIGKGGLVVGGAGGRGVVYEQERPVGYTIMSQGTVGLQAGGQSYSQMILFEDKAALDRFTGAEWAMSAQATAVAAASGAGATAKYKDGVMVYVLNLKGLMGEASVGGQKFTYQPM